MREAFSDILEEVDWRALAFAWLLSLIVTAVLVFADASAPIVALVLAGVGSLIIRLVPRGGLGALMDMRRTRRRKTTLPSRHGETSASYEARGRTRSRTLNERAALALVHSAVGRLPEPARNRWREEWTAELFALRGRPLTALSWAIAVRLAVRALRAELRGEIRHDDRKRAKDEAANVAGLAASE